MTNKLRSYRKHLEDQILATLGLKPRTFPEIVENAGGAFPVDVRATLSRLVGRGSAQRRGRFYRLAGRFQPALVTSPFGNAFNTSANESFRRSRRPAGGPSLPIPHPADYDWRFTPHARANLMNLFLPMRKRSSRVALLGAPSLFLELRRTNTQAVLFDRNPALISRLHSAGLAQSAIQQDMFSDLAPRLGAFDAVLADPPWYLEFYKAFILRASQLLRLDGVLFLSMLPWLTRPSATEDRSKILRLADEAGFHLFGILPDFLQYETPHFERVVLQHHGIRSVHWRRADLFLWIKIRHPDRSAFRIAKPQHDEWQDFLLNNKIIKLKSHSQSPVTSFGYKPVANDSPILRTVSRRWPHRQSIDVWTSDNEAYCVKGLEALRAALSELQSGKTLPVAISSTVAQLHLDSVGAKSLARFLKILSHQ